jgi:hypothetical protein
MAGVKELTGSVIVIVSPGNLLSLQQLSREISATPHAKRPIFGTRLRGTPATLLWPADARVVPVCGSVSPPGRMLLEGEEI